MWRPKMCHVYLKSTVLEYDTDLGFPLRSSFGDMFIGNGRWQTV